MEKDKLIEQMLTEKGNKNNSIDLNAYARGLIDMYDKLVLPQADVIKSVCEHSWQEIEGAVGMNFFMCMKCGKKK